MIIIGLCPWKFLLRCMQACCFFVSVTLCILVLYGFSLLADGEIHCQCLLMGRFLVRYSRPFLPFFLFCLFVFFFVFFCSHLYGSVSVLYWCHFIVPCCHITYAQYRSKVAKGKCFTWFAFTMHIFYPLSNFHFSILRSSVTLFTCRYMYRSLLPSIFCHSSDSRLCFC